MSLYQDDKYKIEQDGFTVINDIFSDKDVENILRIIDQADTNKPTFRKTSELFAIRQFLKEIPDAVPAIFTKKLNTVIKQISEGGYFVVKSIYFDKPGSSNWFVAYHQDLTISVDRKEPIDGFGPWTVKQDQFAVQPPIDILENNFTIRIHLDNTDKGNGALKVIPGSHLRGIYRPETIDWDSEKEILCDVPRGGIMIMKPLLLHASGRSVNQNKRRVIHIEFSRHQLPKPLEWSEYLEIELNPS